MNAILKSGPVTWMRVRRTLQSALGLILKVTTFVTIALVGGLGTSLLAIDRGTSVNAERIGAWTKWSAVGRPNTDPYTRSRFSRQNVLVFNADYISRFEASADDLGRRLHSSCHYAIEGPAIDSTWWHLAVFDAKGRLIANPSNRHGFNKATVITKSNGAFRIDLARDARPGNWIPTSRAGSLIVLLEVVNRSGQANVLGDGGPVLPKITRVSCG